MGAKDGANLFVSRPPKQKHIIKLYNVSRAAEKFARSDPNPLLSATIVNVGDLLTLVHEPGFH